MICSITWCTWNETESRLTSRHFIDSFIVAGFGVTCRTRAPSDPPPLDTDRDLENSESHNEWPYTCQSCCVNDMWYPLDSGFSWYCSYTMYENILLILVIYNSNVLYSSSGKFPKYLLWTITINVFYISHF